MLETIFEWLIAGLTEMLEAVVNYFMYLLHFDIRYIGAQFPILGQTYGIFRTIGIGLAVVFASISIAKFTFGPLAESKETPTQVLFRLAISIGLIYFGGYGLEAIINIVKLPYNYILGLDAVDAFRWSNFGETLELSIAETSAGAVVPGVAAPVLVVGAAAMLIISLIMLILVFVNLMKLIVEVAQRLMWLFVIMYTAPLAFSTFASKTTSEIMRKWLSMFFSQCLLLVLSVWMMEVAISGFSLPAMPNSEHNYVLQFLLTLAACKVGANLDREIQRIGLNPTTANGNVFDEITNAFSQFARESAKLAGGGGGNNGKSPVLGSTTSGAGSRVTSSPASSPSSAPSGSGGKASASASGWRGTVSTMKEAATEGARAVTQSGGGAGAVAAAVMHTARRTVGAVTQRGRGEGNIGFEGGYVSSVSPPQRGDTEGKASSKVSFSPEAQANGAHIAYSPAAKGGVISANTPQQAAAIWNNSVDRAGESHEFSRIMRQTGQAMSKDGATEVFSNSKLKSVDAGPVATQQSGAGAVFRTAVSGAPGMPTFKSSDVASISVKRDASTGAVVTEAMSRGNVQGSTGVTPTGAPSAGHGSRITVANKSAFEAMDVGEKSGFTETGSGTGLYTHITSDFSRQAEAIRSLNAGGPSDSDEMAHTIVDAYGSALSRNVTPQDISNVKVSPAADGAGARVSFDVSSVDEDGVRHVERMRMFNGAEGGREYDFSRDFGEEAADSTRFDSSEDSMGGHSISFASKPPEAVRRSKPRDDDYDEPVRTARRESRPPKKGH